MTAPLFSTPVRFDDAGPLAWAEAREIASCGLDILLIRDVLGRFSLLVDDRTPGESQVPDIAERTERLAAALGPYASQRPVLAASTLFSADSLLTSPRATPDPDGPPSSGHGEVRFLDNTVVGEDWGNVRTPGGGTNNIRTSRTALYGFKGGVGRSTATALLARHLADEGKIVLVADLDLESPGAGPLLTSVGNRPRYGIIDHLVESTLSNEADLDLVVRTPFEPRKGGELWVAPARGTGSAKGPYSYIDKLNRVYADAPGTGSFADRLEAAVHACEAAIERDGDSGRRPDVVLLDSRAGIHDIAAVTISRLCDLALLFGADNEQTWTGYSDLFTSWRDAGQAPAVREKLRMVASMVPSFPYGQQDSYLDAFRERALECFSVLYDEIPPDSPPTRSEDEQTFDTDSFSPPLEDDSAPHHALPIVFDLRLVGVDTTHSPTWQDDPLVRASYAEFLNTATRLILEGS